jgi:tungstate transport system substrate-binding protein
MRSNHTHPILLFFCIFALSLSACAQATPTAQPSVSSLILATTTSTQDSGLLDVLVPDFEAKNGSTVKTVAVGSGQAMEMGAQCNADVLLVHSPSAEEDFMAAGSGKDRLLVMHNDFILLGPADDPAGIKDLASAAEAMKQIADQPATFITRGDDSGTHKKELALWKSAGVEPAGDWYVESGQGMGATLKIASEKGAYTLSDRATYLASQASLGMDILVEGDPELLNIYHVITVNSEKCDQANFDGATAFAKYLISAEAQKLIAEFGKEQYGQPLFFPDAGKAEAEVGNP